MGPQHFQKKVSPLVRAIREEASSYPVLQQFHEDDQVRNCVELKEDKEFIIVDKVINKERAVSFKKYQQGKYGTQAMFYDSRTKTTIYKYLTDIGLEAYSNGRWNNKCYLRVAPVRASSIRRFFSA
jgi:hypothetical protein